MLLDCGTGELVAVTFTSRLRAASDRCAALQGRAHSALVLTDQSLFVIGGGTVRNGTLEPSAVIQWLPLADFGGSSFCSLRSHTALGGGWLRPSATAYRSKLIVCCHVSPTDRSVSLTVFDTVLETDSVHRLPQIIVQKASTPYIASDMIGPFLFLVTELAGSFQNHLLHVIELTSDDNGEIILKEREVCVCVCVFFFF